MPADLEREIWDAIGTEALTRAMLQERFARTSPDALQVKIGALKRRGLLKEANGEISRVSYAVYEPPAPAPGEQPLGDAYRNGADHIFDRRGTVPFADVCNEDREPRAPFEHRVPVCMPLHRVAAVDMVYAGETPAEAPAAPINDEATTAGESDMAETKSCVSCGDDKPLKAFPKRGRGRGKVCQACTEDVRAPGADLSSKTATPATSAPPAPSGSALYIPAGREVRGNVLEQGDGVLLAELVAGFPGQDPDQRIELNRDQVLRAHAWFGKLLAQ